MASLAKPTLPDIILPNSSAASAAAAGGVNSSKIVASAADSPTYGMDERSPSVGSPDFLLSGGMELPPPGTSAADAAATAAAAGSRLSSPGTPLSNERNSPAPPPPRIPRSSSRSPVRRSRPRSRSTSPREPRSRAVPLPDTSLPPPNFHRGKKDGQLADA